MSFTNDDRIKNIVYLAADIGDFLDSMGVQAGVAGFVKKRAVLKSIARYRPLVTADFKPKNGNLTWKFYLSIEGWSITPVVEGKNRSDFGDNLPKDLRSASVCASHLEKVKQVLAFYINEPLALIVHIEDDEGLIHQLFHRTDESKFIHLATRYAYSFTKPIKYEGTEVVFDPQCDKTLVYTRNIPSESTTINSNLMDYFDLIETRSSLAVEREINSLSGIKPISGHIIFEQRS